jgi:hypothetical protein
MTSSPAPRRATPGWGLVAAFVSIVVLASLPLLWFLLCPTRIIEPYRPLALLLIAMSVLSYNTVRLARRRVEGRLHEELISASRRQSRGWDHGRPTGGAANGAATCLVCGGTAGSVLCLGCGQPTLQVRRQRNRGRPPEYIVSGPCAGLRLAALIIHRWPSLLAFVATLYVPGAYSVLREAEKAHAEESLKAANTARDFAAAWGTLRGPLIAFGVNCGPALVNGAAPTSECDRLVEQIVTSWTGVTWHLPSVLVNFREGPCEPGKDLPGPSGKACQKIRGGNPAKASSEAFREFMNSYALHKLQKTPAARVERLKDLGVAAKNFYVASRQLGCVLNFANLAGATAHDQEETSPYCIEYFKKGAGAEDKNPLAWEEWFP